MKRLFFAFLVLVGLSIPAFAQLQVGVAAEYNYPIVVADDPGMLAESTASDFLFGAEARLNFGLLEASAVALYDPIWQAIYADADAGLGISLLGLVRVGAEAGLSYTIDPQSSTASGVGVNVKVLATVSLFGLNVGLTATQRYSSFEELLSTSTSIDPVDSDFLIGASVLLDLF